MTRAAPIVRCCVEFAKDGPARFVSHLDLQATFERALRRARVPLAFSQGFHPRPKLQFEEALPLGWSSDCERLWVELREPYPSFELAQRLGRTAPEGIEVARVFRWAGKPRPARSRSFVVRDLALPDGAETRLAERFPVHDDGLAPVELERVDDTLRFHLRAAPKGQAPSLKKVLEAALGEKPPAALAVRRLALPAQTLSSHGPAARRPKPVAAPPRQREAAG